MQSPPARGSAFPRSLILFIAGVTLVRLWAAAVIPLTEDEAYYRLWSASPQLGYYDHPPMIAWWIAAGRLIAGDTPLGVRLIPVLSCAATTLLVFDLARGLRAAEETAIRAAVWFNATLLVGAGGIVATPDAAAVPFWALTLWCLVRGEEAGQERWWLAAGAAAGLACLSKYSALFLAPGVVLWLLSRPGGLARLRGPWPWLAAAIALAIFGVNIAWNAEHHWMSFAKQFGRVTPGRFQPSYELELAAGQFLLLNPLIAVFAALAARPRDGAEARAGCDLRLIWMTSLPFATYLVVHALHDRVQAHWPAPLYPGLAICAAVGAERFGRVSAAAWARRAAAPLGLGVAAFALIHAAWPATDVLGRGDPVGVLRGWPAFAGRVEAMREARGAAWVGTVSYATDALLADQSGLHAPAIELAERERFPPGDASWRVDLSRPGLVVDLQRRLNPLILGRCFAVVTPAGPLVRGSGADAGQHYMTYSVAQPRLDILKGGC